MIRTKTSSNPGTRYPGTTWARWPVTGSELSTYVTGTWEPTADGFVLPSTDTTANVVATITIPADAPGGMYMVYCKLSLTNQTATNTQSWVRFYDATTSINNMNNGTVTPAGMTTSLHAFMPVSHTQNSNAKSYKVRAIAYAANTVSITNLGSAVLCAWKMHASDQNPVTYWWERTN